MKRVPKHVVKVYGSSHAFRSDKRKIVRRMLRDLGELRRGCVFFPTGSMPVDAIAAALETLRKELSVRSWGR